MVAPLLFVAWTRPPLRARTRIVLEAVVVSCALAGCGLLVFGRSKGFLQHPYMLFPPLAWAALRFGQYGAVVSVFVISAIAIAGTAMGLGPFVAPTLADSLLDVQLFMAVASVTALLLGAAHDEFPALPHRQLVVRPDVAPPVFDEVGVCAERRFEDPHREVFAALQPVDRRWACWHVWTSDLCRA